MPPTPLAARTDRQGEARVWQVPLMAPEAVCEAARRLLDPSEVARADGFHFSRHRRRFILRRAARRLVLASVVGIDPVSLRFQDGPAGKPGVLDPPAARDLPFNTSHSDDLALIAVSSGPALGVDIESHRELTADLWNIRQFFHATERAALDGVPVDLRSQAFFNCWARKEAFMKALGEGLHLSLDAFAVPVTAESNTARSWLLPGLAPDRDPLFLTDLETDRGVSAALVMEKVPATVHPQPWTWEALPAVPG